MTQEEFWNRANVAGPWDCWNWKSKPSSEGYGTSWDNDRNRNVGAHVKAYLYSGREIPEGYHVHHLCENKLCVNPVHLEAVINTEHSRLHIIGQNRARTYQDKVKAKTHCLNGHPLSGDNLYIHPKRGTRHCKQCQRKRDTK